jgi:hypothetical protein
MIAGIGVLVQFAVLALIVTVVVRAVRERQGVSGATDLSGVRRVVQVGFLLVALVALSVGVARLLTYLYGRQVLAGARTEELALGIALVAVAGPIWGLLCRSVLRAVRDDDTERAALPYAMFLVVALTGSLIVAVVHLIQVGELLTGSERTLPGAPGYAAVGLVVWSGHEWLRRHPRLAPTSPILALSALAGSVVGLVTVAVGAVSVLGHAFEQLYALAAAPPLALGPQEETLLRGLILVAVGAPVWWWHWSRQAELSPRDLAWHTYVLLVPVLGGVVAALVALTWSIHTVLEWYLGDPASFGAPAHFSTVPMLLAVAIVGLGVSWYHRVVLRSGSAPAAAGRAEPERVQRALLTAVGLVAAGVGVVMAVAAGIQLTVPSPLAETDPEARRSLLVAASLVLVGAPLWAVSWRHVQLSVRSGSIEEVRSPTRRVQVLGVLVLTALASAVSVAVILYQVLRDLLAGTLGVAIVTELSIALAVVVTAGVIAVYHGTVLWEDRARRADMPREEPEVRLRRVLLVSPDGNQLAAAVASGTGARVRNLHRTDSPHVDVDPDRVAAALRDVHATEVLVTVDADGEVRVIPYEEG